MRVIEIYFQQISNEILNWATEKRNFLEWTGKMIIVVILALSSAFPSQAWHIFTDILKWKSCLIPFLIQYYILVFYGYPLLKKKNTDILFFGVPINNIVSYLLENKGFKLDSVSRHFNISRSVAQEMLDFIDPTDILVRGKNNARILNIGLSREDIINSLTIKLEPRPQETEETSHTYTEAI